MDFNFTINDFEGPLDLLLHLVKSSKMDIYSVNIKELIDEYLQFIKANDINNIDVSSEYLVMAAELIHLKSKLLVNDNEEDEEDEYTINSEEDLRNKLADYQNIKGITSTFRDLAASRQEIYEKLPENLSHFNDIEIPKNVYDIDKLYEAFLELQNKLQLQHPLNTKITRKEISIDDRIKDIRKILNLKCKVNFIELFDNPTKEYIIVTFISILDMSKNKEIMIEQVDTFKPIMIEKR